MQRGAAELPRLGGGGRLKTAPGPHSHILLPPRNGKQEIGLPIFRVNFGKKLMRCRSRSDVVRMEVENSIFGDT